MGTAVRLIAFLLKLGDLQTMQEAILKLATGNDYQALRYKLRNINLEPFIRQDDIPKATGEILGILIHHNLLLEPEKARIELLIPLQKFNGEFIKLFRPNDRHIVAKFSKTLKYWNWELASHIWAAFTEKQRDSYCKKFPKLIGTRQMVSWLLDHNIVPNFGNAAGISPYIVGNFRPVGDLPPDSPNYEMLCTFRYQSTKCLVDFIKAHRDLMVHRWQVYVSEECTYFDIETQEGRQLLTTFGWPIEDPGSRIELLRYQEPASTHKCAIYTIGGQRLAYPHEVDRDNDYARLLEMDVSPHLLLYIAIHCDNLAALQYILAHPRAAGADIVSLIFSNTINNCIRYLLQKCFTDDHFRQLIAKVYEFCGVMSDQGWRRRCESTWAICNILRHQIHDERFESLSSHLEWSSLPEAELMNMTCSQDHTRHLKLMYEAANDRQQMAKTIRKYVCPTYATTGQFADGVSFKYFIPTGDLFVKDGSEWVEDSSRVPEVPIQRQVSRKSAKSN